MEILQEEPDFKDKNFEAAADDGEKPVAGGLFDLSSKGLLAGLSGDGDLYELIQQEVKRDSKKVAGAIVSHIFETPDHFLLPNAQNAFVSLGWGVCH